MREVIADTALEGVSDAPDAGLGDPAVLVIDDSRVIRRAVVKALSSEFTLIEAEDGETGWQHIVSNPHVQVVVSDVEMPRLDGYSLICRMRASDEQRIRELPVIVITGAQDDTTRERAFACGATDFVIKPLDSAQLLARARAHARLDQTAGGSRETAISPESPDEQSGIVDPLTELHSRRYFLQRATQDIALARRHGQDLAVIRIDFDDFRAVYQRYGDDACDQMFIWLAGVMRANTRTEDTLARIRGGEFAILAPSSDRQEATALCERLRRAVRNKPFHHDGAPVSLTISLGLATLTGDRVETITGLLARAEQRLTLAKAGGGDQLGIGYEEEVLPPEEAVIEEPDLETALKLLADGNEGKLLPYLPGLLARALPLLELCDRQLDLDLGDTLRSLRERLGFMK